MARLQYPDTDSPEARQLVEEVRRQRGGRFPHLFHMQMYNPAILDGWLRLGSAVRFKSDLDDPTRELAICLVARTTGAEYEWRGEPRRALRIRLFPPPPHPALHPGCRPVDDRPKTPLRAARRRSTN